MKNTKLYIAAALLLAVTLIAAVIHLTGRTKTAEGDIQLTAGGKTYQITVSELDYEQITGVRLNGKGEEIHVDAPGITLKDLLSKYDIISFTSVTVISDDSYSASVTAERCFIVAI